MHMLLKKCETPNYQGKRYRQGAGGSTTPHVDGHVPMVIENSTVHQFTDHTDKVIAVIGFGNVSVKL